MQVETVTMWIPCDSDQEASHERHDFEEEAFRLPIWYRCARSLCALLRDRKIARLRLLIALDDYKSRVGQPFHLYHWSYEPYFLPANTDPNRLEAIRKLNPTLEARVVEPLARSKFKDAHEGIPAAAYGPCTSRFENYIESLRAGSQRTFVLSREDCCGVDEGTVMILRLSDDVDDDFICQERPKWRGHHRKAETT